MSVEVFFVHPSEAGTLTLAELTADLSQAGLVAKISEDKSEQVWVEFQGYRSRLLLGKEEPLALITLQYGWSSDTSNEDLLVAKIEELLRPHGYVDGEQFYG